MQGKWRGSYYLGLSTTMILSTMVYRVFLKTYIMIKILKCAKNMLIMQNLGRFQVYKVRTIKP